MWFPEAVYILDENFNISELPGADIHNEPQSVFGWMQAELRENPYLSAYECSLIIDIWMDAFAWVFGRTQKYASVSKYDRYNVAWAVMGYTEGQSGMVCRLANEYLELQRSKVKPLKTSPAARGRSLLRN